MTRNKYHAKKTTIDGILFDSHAEALRYMELKLLMQTGIVKDIECQPVFTLQPGFWKCCDCHEIWGSADLKKGKCRLCGGKVPKTSAITYIADFRITYADGHQEIEDIKGFPTAMFLLKKKLFEYRYPELTLKIVKGRR